MIYTTESLVTAVRVGGKHEDRVESVTEMDHLLTTFKCVILRKRRASRAELWGACSVEGVVTLIAHASELPGRKPLYIVENNPDL